MNNSIALSPREMFDAGDITPHVALQDTLAQYATVQDQLAPLEEVRAMVRADVEYLLPFAGRKFTYAGLDVMEVEPAQTVSYDAKGLDAYLLNCRSTGEVPDIDVLLSHRKVNTRKGSIRIVAAKEAVR